MSSSLPPYEPQPSYLRSLMHDYHQQINAQTDATVADLQQRWIAARAALNADIARLQQQMETAIAKGDQITYAWLADAQRLAALKASVEGNIAQFADGVRDLVAQGQLSALDLGTDAAQEMLAATVPPGLSYTFGVPPADVLHAQAGALSPTSPLTALFAQMGPEAAKSAQAAIFTSVALGEGPRAAATRLFWNTNIPRQRAEVIARTEILRSWRGAQMENYRANQDVVSGWQWSADFSDRTCFPAGTLIQTRQGPIPIEQVRVGDEALTHAGRYQRVLRTMERVYVGEMVTLTTIDGNSVTATVDHPFLLRDTLGWMEAVFIRIGSRLVSHDNCRFSHEIVANSAREEWNGPVYNLEVAEDHSYFANGYAVHNCGACIALDGTIHTLDEDLDDHIMGRCSALPITRPWSDILAGTGADTSGLTETSIASWDSYLYGNGFAADWFDGLAPEVQNSILGPAKAEAYRQGDIDLKDLAGVRRDPVWGDSIEEVSLKQLGMDAQDYLAAARANGTESVVADAEALAQAQAGTPAAQAEKMAETAAADVTPITEVVRSEEYAAGSEFPEPVVGDANGATLAPPPLLSDNLPFTLEQFDRATLTPLNSQLAGVNDAYTARIGGQKYLIKSTSIAGSLLSDVGDLSGAQYQAIAEATATQAGDLLGFGHYMTPTYFFEANGETYVAAQYVANVKPWAQIGFDALAQQVPEAQLRDMVLQEYVVGDIDRNMGNYLLNPKTGDVYMIDQGFAFKPEATATVDSISTAAWTWNMQANNMSFAGAAGWANMPLDAAQLQQIAAQEPQILALLQQQGLDAAIPGVQARMEVLREAAALPDPTYADLQRLGDEKTLTLVQQETQQLGQQEIQDMLDTYREPGF